MGRPSLKVRKTTVRLPAEDMAFIESVVGKRAMARFIREAVSEKICRLKRPLQPKEVRPPPDT